MNLALIVPEFPPDTIGGGGPVFESLALALQRRGHAVRVLTASTWGGPEGDDAAYGFSLRRVREFRHFSPRLRTYMPPLPGALRGVRAFLQGAQVFNLHGYGMPFIDAMFNAFVPANRCVFTTHGFPYAPAEIGGAVEVGYALYERAIGSRILKRSARITAISSALAAEVRAGYARDVVTIHNGFVSADPQNPIDPRLQTELEKGPYVLGVGRLEERKGFAFTIRAAAMLRERGTPIRVVIAGADNGAGSALRALARDLGLSAAVSFTGELPRGQLGHCYRRAACVVMSPLVETFGLVSLEAMSNGVPVVASAVGGIPDVVRDRENGLLVPPRDATAISRCVEAVMNDAGLRASLAAAGRETVAKFSWDAIAERYEAVYEDCRTSAAPR